MGKDLQDTQALSPRKAPAYVTDGVVAEAQDAQATQVRARLSPVCTGQVIEGQNPEEQERRAMSPSGCSGVVLLSSLSPDTGAGSASHLGPSGKGHAPPESWRANGLTARKPTRA